MYMRVCMWNGGLGQSGCSCDWHLMVSVGCKCTGIAVSCLRINSLLLVGFKSVHTYE